MAKTEEMYQGQMSNCGFIYCPKRGDKKGKISAWTRFEGLSEAWHFPCCGAGPKMFRPLVGGRFNGAPEAGTQGRLELLK